MFRINHTALYDLLNRHFPVLGGSPTSYVVRQHYGKPYIKASYQPIGKVDVVVTYHPTPDEIKALELEIVS